MTSVAWKAPGSSRKFHQVMPAAAESTFDLKRHCNTEVCQCGAQILARCGRSLESALGDEDDGAPLAERFFNPLPVNLLFVAGSPLRRVPTPIR